MSITSERAGRALLLTLAAGPLLVGTGLAQQETGSVSGELGSEKPD